MKKNKAIAENVKKHDARMAEIGGKPAHLKGGDAMRQSMLDNVERLRPTFELIHAQGTTSLRGTWRALKEMNISSPRGRKNISLNTTRNYILALREQGYLLEKE